MTYNSESIEVLEGLDPVKTRPGMYTDTDRPNHLFQEVLDNSVDEALAGHANKIIVTLTKDNFITVEDNGRGMPVDIHSSSGLSGVELIMTKLHAGGKFSKTNYKFSGGLHGVGISVVNALSERVNVTVYRDGKEYLISFENGFKVSDLVVVGESKKKGTVVSFKPNPKYFDTDVFSISKIVRTLKSKAVLLSGLHIVFKNEKEDKKEEWIYKNGSSDYFSENLNEIDVLPNKLIQFKGSSETFEYSVMFIWSDSSPSVINESYVNLIPTFYGGTHVKVLRDGLLDAFREFCEHRNLLDKNLKITSDDVFDRINYLIDFKLSEPSFAGQTKEKLSSKDFESEARSMIKDSMYDYLTNNLEEANVLAEMIISKAKQRSNSKNKVVRKKTIGKIMLPGKLADCKSNSLEETEIFFVEGDSAGGSAKQARNKENQAIMPLRGKILNTWELESHEILSSNEINDISQAIGVEPGNSNLDGLRYGKVCILADADSDGLHIATLFCALFFKHFKELVKAGHLYVSVPPLYRIDVGKKVFYAQDESDKKRILEKVEREKIKGQVSVQRFKGLGEMNPDQLSDTTMNPENRVLLQVTTEDENFENEIIDMLLAKKKADLRKKWLSEKGGISLVSKESKGEI